MIDVDEAARVLRQFGIQVATDNEQMAVCNLENLTAVVACQEAFLEAAILWEIAREKTTPKRLGQAEELLTQTTDQLHSYQDMRGASAVFFSRQCPALICACPYPSEDPAKLPETILWLAQMALGIIRKIARLLYGKGCESGRPVMFPEPPRFAEP